MNKITKRILISALIGAINVSSTGCGLTDNSNDTAIVQEVNTQENTFEENNTVSKEEVVDNTSITEVIEDISSKDNINEIISKLNITTKDVVTTNYRTLVVNDNQGVLGNLDKGITVDCLGTNGDYYKIRYYDSNENAYVNKDLVTFSTIYDISSSFSKVLYSTQEIDMTIPDYLSNSNKEEVVRIPYHEIFEVFEESDDFYVVRCNDMLGYIGKENVEELTGTFVVVDISDQEVTMYKDNQIILDTPCVTGKDKTPTHEGLFYVYDITRNRYLVGPGYETWVDYMVSFNDGEGLHDAEYHSCSANSNHGWRALNEFGGDTYKRYGSHGCVNMYHDKAAIIYENSYINMPVLVKK